MATEHAYVKRIGTDGAFQVLINRRIILTYPDYASAQQVAHNINLALSEPS